MNHAFPIDGLESAHWLEHLSENLEHLPDDARRIAYSLLYSPWKCSRDDVLKYVPSPLGESIVFLQESVFRHIFSERSCLSVGIAALDVEIGAYVAGPNGPPEPLDHNTGIAVETYVGLAKEDLAKVNVRWTAISRPAQASLLALYVKCEVAVHLMAGMLEVANAADGTMHYVVPGRLQAARKMRWFSLYWAQQSNMADIFNALMVSHSLGNFDGVRKSESFQALVDIILDKYLGLHRHYVPKLLQTKNGAVLPKIWERAELLCFVWLHPFATGWDGSGVSSVILDDHPMASIPREHLLRAGFGNAEVDALLEESAAQPLGDQFITQTDDSQHLNVHGLNLKFTVQRYLRSLFKKIGSPIGHWFERDYILQYLQEHLESERFMVWPEFKDAEEGYDADIIVYDNTTRIFYFCQVKHRAQVMQPYLRDELNEFCRGENINHGIKQLSRLRELIDAEKVRKRLVSKIGKKLVGEEPLSERSRFILIHTVENFDMCTNYGITMYEWNTFRNLLQGLMLHARRDLDGTMQYETKDLDFSNLGVVREHLMGVVARSLEEIAPNHPTPADAYAFQQYAELSLQTRKSLWINKKSFGKFKMKMLRIPLL